jgi:hypothetical protein
MKKMLAVLAVLALGSIGATTYNPTGRIGATQADSAYNSQRQNSGVMFIDSVFADTCAVGFKDSSRVYNGLGYDLIEVEMIAWPVGDTCGNTWTKVAVGFENVLVGLTHNNRQNVADSVASSLSIDEPQYNLSGQGTLSGDSLTWANVPQGQPNMRGDRLRPGETQVLLGPPRWWNNGKWGGHAMTSFELRRNSRLPLRFFRLYIRPLQQSCTHSSTPAARFYARVYLYRLSSRTTP